jgi:chorismate synthase
MPGNTIGKVYSLRSFGESHGKAVGGIIDGCPPGLRLSEEAIQRQLDRRRPGASPLVSPRQETDRLEILSGLFRGLTTGMPLAFLVYNRDARSEAYNALENVLRPSHADRSWQAKYGVRDHRGGGRSSAREHIARVVAGAIARQYLAPLGITISAHASAIGDVRLDPEYPIPPRLPDTPLACPDPLVEARMIERIQEVARDGDSIGGVVACLLRGLPPGVGEPVFDRFQARLAHYMMSINAAKGFEYGEGFRAATLKGSQHNDPLRRGAIPVSNRAGGILGGVTTGEDIRFRVAFKPTPTIALPQQTATITGEEIELKITGRHDPCVIPRVLPVVEAMTAMLALDMMLEGGLYPLKLTPDARP